MALAEEELVQPMLKEPVIKPAFVPLGITKLIEAGKLDSRDVFDFIKAFD